MTMTTCRRSCLRSESPRLIANYELRVWDSWPRKDCGGPHTFAETLRALTDPKHDDHDHDRKWLSSFNTETFVSGLATAPLAALGTAALR